MIPAATQTLAEILAGGTSLLSTEQIDFNHPGVRQDAGPGLNLYCYNIRENGQVHHSGCQVEYRVPQEGPSAATGKSSILWFDVSFLVSAWDFTSLGGQRLLSEALTLLLSRRWLQEESLPLSLRGHGDLLMTVSAVKPIDAAALWSALGVPLRPALYVTVTIPVYLQGESSQPKETMLTSTKLGVS